MFLKKIMYYAFVLSCTFVQASQKPTIDNRNDLTKFIQDYRNKKPASDAMGGRSKKIDTEESHQNKNPKSQISEK